MIDDHLTAIYGSGDTLRLNLLAASILTRPPSKITWRDGNLVVGKWTIQGLDLRACLRLTRQASVAGVAELRDEHQQVVHVDGAVAVQVGLTPSASVPRSTCSARLG